MLDTILSFFHRNIFLFELLIAYLPFAGSLKPRKEFPIRLVLNLGICICFSHFVRFPFWQWESSALAFIYDSCWYFVVAALTIAGIRLCFHGSWWNAVFYGISAYLMQHTFFRVKFSYEYIYRYFSINETWLNYLSYWAATFIVYLLFYLLIVRKAQLSQEFHTDTKQIINHSILALTIVLVLSKYIAVISQNYRSIEPSYFFLITAFSMLCCIVLLGTLFNSISRIRMEDEMHTLNALWANAQKQYETSKQNAELLSMKYHDLKYLINAVRAAHSTGSLDRVLQESSELLSDYEHSFNTGNEALDVVLTEKSLQGRKESITIQSVADGTVLNGMEDVDIYALFGNALDNALESLRTVADMEQRVVEVFVKRVNNMAKIEIVNFAEVTPTFVNGLPQTTKADKLNHGYGTKSIRYIVDKYHGFVQFSRKDEKFILEIILNIG